jgi:FkbM family methyltransferase
MPRFQAQRVPGSVHSADGPRPDIDKRNERRLVQTMAPEDRTAGEPLNLSDLRMRVARLGRLLRVVQLRRSLRGLRQLRRAGRSRHVPDAPVALRVKALEGRRLWVRPRTTDLTTLIETFDGAYHLPPRGSDLRGARTIWDLGSNAGFTIAHFAHLCPSARIVGVELDSGNAAMARANIQAWADRCAVIQAGVWVHDGTLQYHRQPGSEYAFRVSQSGDADAGRANASARALSLNTLLAGAPSGSVDYVKMDIEGAERQVLRENTEWAATVKAITVEIHEPYSIPECIADLRALGFKTSIDSRHRACVIGAR